MLPCTERLKTNEFRIKMEIRVVEGLLFLGFLLKNNAYFWAENETRDIEKRNGEDSSLAHHHLRPHFRDAHKFVTKRKKEGERKRSVGLCMAKGDIH